jgi:hypothetical protein
MNPPFRLLASLSVGVVHYALTLILGPRLVCAFGGTCVDPLTGGVIADNIFDFPLSVVRTAASSAFEGRSFPFYAAINSLAFALLVWVALSLFARFRPKPAT